MSENTNENVLNKGAMVEAMLAKYPNDFPSKAAADRIVRGMFAMMAAHIASGGVVRVQDFGTFETYESAPRTGRSPATHEVIEIPGSVRVRFRAAGALKAACNKDEA